MKSDAKTRILIADSHPEFRDRLHGLLSGESDLEVMGEVDTHEVVLAALNECDPDVLLLDLHLPTVGALTLLPHLEPLKRKILVLSNAEYEGLYTEVMRSGASGIVPKRAVDASLVAGIRKVYRGETWLDSKTLAAVMNEFAASHEKPRPTCWDVGLSSLDHQIVGLLVQGSKNREIAEQLFVTEQTVKNHLHTLYKKFGVSSRLELAVHIGTTSHHPV